MTAPNDFLLKNTDRNKMVGTSQSKQQFKAQGHKMPYGLCGSLVSILLTCKCRISSSVWTSAPHALAHLLPRACQHSRLRLSHFRLHMDTRHYPWIPALHSPKDTSLYPFSTVALEKEAMRLLSQLLNSLFVLL